MLVWVGVQKQESEHININTPKVLEANIVDVEQAVLDTIQS
jgi:hypothetical protein